MDKTRNIKLYLLTTLLFAFSATNAQDYNEAVGARIGVRSGVVYKNYFDYENSVQAMLNFQNGGAQFVFVRQFYQPVMLGLTQKLFFYYGFGGHLGFSMLSNDVYELNGEFYRRKEFSATVGIDANLGLEYHVIKYPVILSVDYQPFNEISVPIYFRQNYFDFAFTIIYAF